MAKWIVLEVFSGNIHDILEEALMLSATSILSMKGYWHKPTEFPEHWRCSWSWYVINKTSGFVPWMVVKTKVISINHKFTYDIPAWNCLLALIILKEMDSHSWSYASKHHLKIGVKSCRTVLSEFLYHRIVIPAAISLS